MKYLPVFVICVIAWASAAPESRITGGAAAIRNQFPYQVSVQWGLLGIWQHVCGGSILTLNRVLTAGHCVTDRPAFGGFRIRAGILNVNENFEGMQVVTALAVVHPDYTGGDGPNDLAILILSVNLVTSAAVNTIGLPTANVVPTGTAILTGWGSTSATAIPNMPDTLQHVTVTILASPACVTALGPLGPLLTATNVCTGPGPAPIGLAACLGDSGGPLAQNNMVIGVVSWGTGRVPCGAAGIPSVYVQTSSFIPWITANLLNVV